MKKFILYTIEGYTESPTGKNVENCQVIGFSEGINERQAIEQFLTENIWVKESGFDEGKIMLKQLLDDGLKTSLRTVIDYLWSDEERHYQELCEDEDFYDKSKYPKHIFHVLKELKEKISD